MSVAETGERRADEFEGGTAVGGSPPPAPPLHDVAAPNGTTPTGDPVPPHGTTPTGDPVPPNGTTPTGDPVPTGAPSAENVRSGDPPGGAHDQPAADPGPTDPADAGGHEDDDPGDTGPYDADFFAAIDPQSYASARVVVPRVIGLTGARSVVDVGCGSGAWTRACRDLGVPEVVGVDGAGVPPELRTQATSFVEHDLALPLRLARPFGLAICVEVAEHLSPERAPGLIADLAALAPVVLFSAAVPGQGGTGHLNEQWSEYWVALWEAEGWTCRDAIRPWVRAREDVAWWYRQNLYLAVSPSAAPAYSSFPQLAAVRPEHPVDYIVRPYGDVMTPPAPPPPRPPDPSGEPRPETPGDLADSATGRPAPSEDTTGFWAESDAAGWRPGAAPPDPQGSEDEPDAPRDPDEHPKPPGWDTMRRVAGRFRRRPEA